jgi:orotate phosphoribosyltransferase
MDEKTVKEELMKAGAILEGHFKLSSGLHSSMYVQCALALAHPLLAERLSEALAEKMGYPLADVVLGPALGGVIVAQELARALSRHHGRDVLSYFSERKNGVMELRRGFVLNPGQKVLLVEDVVTTGKSILESAELVTKAGAEIIGWGSIVDRSSGKFASIPPLVSLLTLEIQNHDPEKCPLCAQGLEVVKPGSRPEKK